MKKLLCVDLDGTLLNCKKELTEENRQAVRLAYERGMEICIASGRTYGAASAYLKEMGIEGSVVALNGGQVVHRDVEILRETMAAEVVRAAARIILATGACGYFNDGSRTIVVNGSQKWKGSNPQPMEFLSDEELIHWLESEQTGIIKVSIQESDGERLEMIRSCLSGLEASIAKSDVDYLDVYGKQQSKWTGIEALLRHLNIKAADCVAFGDNENDYEMIKHSGLGIVMSNGTEKLKALADRITSSNEENGVANGLYKWVL
ncbi:Cof-type HAD-IIB family hydrolase [Clostridium sp. MCC353]|uniref:HAD family hydrolase n=1 Tax=Clostridium sp. MCC353 TaxID=2592646 RepID=UPI0020792036|nr:Cof-type HAD-IIB family hydrolase [Clostridium sp. MCC353]